MRRKLSIAIGLVALIVALAAWQLHRRHAATPTTAVAPAGSATAASRATGPHIPAAPASVAGRVTRKPDGSGVAGAIVSITRADLGAMFEPSQAGAIIATSDTTGAWLAPKVPPGTYLVTAMANGLLPASHDRLVIAAGEQRTGIDLALEAGGTLVHGTVTDVGGGTIANARVTVRRADSFQLSSGASYVAVTGADGTYQLTLSEGAFLATASHDDYTKVSHDLEVAHEPLVVDFALIPGGVIRGQVIAHDTGKPVAGAFIDASRGHNGGSGPGDTVSDADGRFTVRGLHSGAIRLTAAGRGYASAAPTVVELAIGDQVDGIKVLVDRAFSISGTVVKKHEPATGVPGVRLGAFSMSAGQTAMAPDPTDATGRFEIIGVRPASYTLFAIGEGSVPEIGKSVEVVDRDITGVTIEMGVGVTISGRVDPAASASVGLKLAGNVGLANMFEMAKAMIVHADTDAAGLFVLHNAPAGKLVVTATTKDGRKGELPVTVADVDQLGLVIPLEPRASISGKVIDTNGAPVADASVDANATEQHMGLSFNGGNHTTTTADGSFHLVGLDAGKFTISASVGNDAFQNLRDKDHKPVEVELAKGAEHAPITLTVEAHDGSIHGVVIGGDGKPAPDAWVTARADRPDVKTPADEDSDWLEAGPPALAGADGTFVIGKLRHGTYTLVADGPSGASRTERKGIKTGESVTLTLASLGTLAGRVTANGAPVAIYDLWCTGPAGPIMRRITVPDGSYALEHLAPGAYVCEASADGGSVKGTVDVPTGDAHLNLALVNWASITGQVVSALSGQPVAITVVAGKLDGKAFGQALTGQAPTTGADGWFMLDRVASGSGQVMLLPKDGGFAPLSTTNYTVTDGQRLDLGAIKVVPPRTGDAGTLGMATEVKDGKLVVTLVAPGGPAEQAGVQVGDSIVSIDGHTLTDVGVPIGQQLLASGNVNAGQVIALGLARGVTATLTAAKW